MTTTIKARVYKSHPDPEADISERQWRAFVTRNGVYWFTAGTAQSMPEALQLAYLGLRCADRWLMEPLHASRASRREAAPVEVQLCRCGHNEWQHQVAGTHCGSFLPGSLKRCWCTHYQPQHVTEDPNTMEATA